jgi:hypothetical protein
VDEIVDAGFGARLDRVEVARRTGDGRVVAVEDRQQTAGAQNARRLRQSEVRPGDMAQGCVEYDDVERRVLQRKRTPVALNEAEVRKVMREVSRLFDEDRRRIDPDDLPHTRMGRECPRHRPAAATHFYDTRDSRKLEVREVRLSHLPLLRIGRPQLEDVDEPFDDRPVGFGDRRVDVRHGRGPD